MRQPDAAAYYTLMGDDVVDFLNEGYVNESKPLWLIPAGVLHRPCGAGAIKPSPAAGVEPNYVRGGLVQSR